MSRRLLLAGLIAVAIAVGAVIALGADGSGGATGEEPVVGVGQVRAGSSASLAQCSDWLKGSEEERAATIDDLYAQLNQSGAGGPTPDLSDEDAYALFERACVNEYAAAFRLYKIYARDAAYSTLLGD